jgi:hypothetical protein
MKGYDTTHTCADEACPRVVEKDNGQYVDVDAMLPLARTESMKLLTFIAKALRYWCSVYIRSS